MITIYDDHGASGDCVQALTEHCQREEKSVICLSGSELQKDDWQRESRLLIMPGGRSLPFYQTLGKRGNQQIIRFVENGGCYLGLCAGAYYACRQTIFASGLPESLTLPGELNFFTGDAVGPVYAAEDFAYRSEQGARVVNVTYGFDDKFISPVYFNGGCYFESMQLNENQIAARYVDNSLPAIIVFHVGSGKVVLSGVHPELSYRTIPKVNDLHHEDLRESLKMADIQRQKLLRFLFDLCLV